MQTGPNADKGIKNNIIFKLKKLNLIYILKFFIFNRIQL